MVCILIVEDEMLIVMMFQDIVSDLGYQFVGLVMWFELVLDVVLCDDFDFVILDLNLVGKQFFFIVDWLLDCGILFFFVIGYGWDGLIDGYCDLFVV